MTKGEFVERFAEKTGMSKKAAADAVEAFIGTIEETVKAGDKVVFPGTFKAELKDIPARTGRNPQTGEEMIIPAKKAIKVKVTAKL